MKKEAALVRQGDVLFIPIEAKESDLEDHDAGPGPGLLVAVGESSGHGHYIFGRGAKLMRYKGTQRVVALVDDGGEVRVVGGGAGVVDRHTPVQLAPGRFEIRIQRAWSSANASRRVED